MTIPNTTPITVHLTLQDSFTGPAAQAFEQFRSNAESAFQAVAVAGVDAFTRIQAAQATALKPPEHSPEFWLSGGLVEKLKGSFEGLTMMFKDGFNALADGMAQWGGILVDRFVAGFTERWDAVKSNIGSLIPDSLRKWLLQKSPAELGVLDSEAWGAKVPELFAEGMLQNASLVGNAADDMARNLQSPIYKADEHLLREGQAVEQVYKNISTAASANTLVFKQFGFAISASFEDAILKGESFAAVLQKLAFDIEKIILRLTVTRAVESAIGNFGDGENSGVLGFLGSQFNGGGGEIAAGSNAFITGTNAVSLGDARRGSAGDSRPVTVNMVIQSPDANTFRRNQGAILNEMRQAVGRGGRNA